MTKSNRIAMSLALREARRRNRENARDMGKFEMRPRDPRDIISSRTDVEVVMTDTTTDVTTILKKSRLVRRDVDLLLQSVIRDMLR